MLPGSTHERTGIATRVTARAMITCGWLSRPSLLWPRLRSGAYKRPAHSCWSSSQLVDLEVGGGGVIEDQIDIEAEQVGGVEEHITLDLVGPDCQKVERAIALIDR